MEISFTNKPNLITFFDLDIGETFASPDNYPSDHIFVVISDDDFVTGDKDYDGRAFCLNNGRIYEFYNGESVRRVQCKITATYI